MFNIPFFNKNKNALGIDIGSSSIKIIEVSFDKGQVNLVNYGEKIIPINKADVSSGNAIDSVFSSRSGIGEAIKDVIKKAGIKTKDATLSIPSFMSFFTVFTAPPMSKEEVKTVVQFEAKQHIPMPLSEVALDWSIIEEGSTGKGPKILLVAVPNRTIDQYQEISQVAGINLLAVEAEVFSLARSVIQEPDIAKTVLLVNIGFQNTTIAVVENGLIKSTYNTNFSVMNIIKHLATKLGIEYNEAEKLIMEIGFSDEKLSSVLSSKINILTSETKQVADSFSRSYRRSVEKIILTGGFALIPGVCEFFTKNTGIPTELANSFSKINYDPSLNKVINEMNSRYAVALGLAIREFKKIK